MKVIYRGHEIIVAREKCLAGYKLLYFTIVRLNDGFIVEDSFSDCDDTVRDMIRCLKERVDNEIAEINHERRQMGQSQ